MRSDTPVTFDERAVLTSMLDYARATVRYKSEGLTEELAGESPVPTSPLLTFKGLVNHLYWVEKTWIEQNYLGRSIEGPWTDEEPDREFAVALEYPLAALLDQYDEQCATYNRLLEGHSLDTSCARPIRDGRRPALRWVLQHLIEETARHNGHLDVLRELLDGSRGV
jgi:uncharacterized damage-inducible protein DinB